MKIALFGGTFDPIHKGHLAIAQAAVERFGIGLVHFVPATVPPHKQGRQVTEFCHRYAMLALATAHHPHFVPSLLEAATDGPSYSIDTVRQLKKDLRKSDQLYFLIGIDAFLDLSTWRQPVELLTECNFIVCSRPGYSLADVGRALPAALRPSKTELAALRRRKSDGVITLPSTTIHMLGHVKESVSSTRIRAAVARKMEIQLDQMVPEAVAGYIRKQQLYVPRPATHEKQSANAAKVLSFDREQHG
ncbi:MAG TPA: nicotinate-nucleotide adenylyltransferase [Candidatus Saccharimonadales bacterium]|jgi:nicotinate-nucleotide adenylyltransferase|nr:nicotinate-nucleotide adenylyltransferase [Candidatus Saccharimonadales bacterium]